MLSRQIDSIPIATVEAIPASRRDTAERKTNDRRRDLHARKQCGTDRDIGVLSQLQP